MSCRLSPDGSTVYGSIGKAEDFTKDQETLKVDLNLLLVRRKQLTRRSYALSARSRDITRMNVRSSRRIGSPRSSSRRRGLWQPGMILNQKKKILMRNKLPLHLWPKLKLRQKLSQWQKPNQILMKKMRYFHLSP